MEMNSSGGSVPSSPNIMVDECNRREPLLSPSPPVDMETTSWKLDLSDFRIPERSSRPEGTVEGRCSFSLRPLLRTPSMTFIFLSSLTSSSLHSMIIFLFSWKIIKKK